MDNNSIPNNFNWKYYFKANPDVEKYYGHLGKEGAESHWKQYGYKENRRYCGGSNVTNPLDDDIRDGKKEITIVIPNKLGEDPEVTINSLYQQTYNNFDIIIINDYEGNANKARNKGLQKVSTPYVLFSDNDISWYPTAIEDLYVELKNDPTISFTYGSWKMDGVIHSNESWDEEKLLKSNYISTMSLVRVEDHPGFDENIKRMQDWDVWLTMIENGHKGKFINKEIFSTLKRKGISTNSISWDEAYSVISKKHFYKNKENHLISFVIPIMGRDYHIEGLEKNIEKMFSDFKYELLYIHQEDYNLFMRGQLCNIGFKESKGDLVIFQDVDIRHLNKFDPYSIMNTLKSPYVAFDKITQLNEPSIGNYSIIETESRESGWGACSIFTRDQFVESGGFSNLVFGWGAEDNIMNTRCNFKRFKQNLGHVYHYPLRFDEKTQNSKFLKNNRDVLYSQSSVSSKYDNFSHTEYKVEKKILKSDNIINIHVGNITVPSDFKYSSLYQEYYRVATNTMDCPFFTIITPSFNSTKILETIESVKKQTFMSFEHIIVDDGSTDSTINIIKNNSYENLRFFNRPDTLPKNANSCRNYGITQSKGKFIIFLDSDDILLDTCLENRYYSMNKNADMNIFHMGKFKNHIKESDKLSISNSEKYEKLIDNYLSYINIWQITSVVWKKNFINGIGGFDVNLHRFQDFDLHLWSLLNNPVIEKYPWPNIDCFYRNSEFFQTINKEKKILILSSALYLINKYEEKGIQFYQPFYTYLLNNYGNIMSKDIKSFITNKEIISLKSP